MPDPKSRARVQRLIEGEFRPDDLTGLFLYARDHCDGREPVAEIGHFVAHHHERDRGIITRATRDWFIAARYHMARFTPFGTQQYRSNTMPRATHAYYLIASSMIAPTDLKRLTGLRRSEAQEMLNSVAGRMTKNKDGTWALPMDLTSKEIDLINGVGSLLAVRPAFTSDKLSYDFIETLKSNSLITKEELKEHRQRIERLVILYAIAAMHNCVVTIGDGTKTQIRGTAVRPKGIAILAEVPLETYEEKVRVAAPMFQYDEDLQLCCEPELLDGGPWDFEIELSSSGHLARLG